jgi:hypothetical protein
MKIKRFKNLWLMGIIIIGALLVGFELIKLIKPEFIIEIAEIPSVVKFGNYVQNNLWAYYLFVFTTSFVSYWFLCCACCRKKYLNWKECLIISIIIITLYGIQHHFIIYYSLLNTISLVLVPILLCIINKYSDKKYFISIFVVNILHQIFQILSLEIKNLVPMVNYPNIISVTILLIDMFIWQILLYNYFNYKENK